MAVLPTSHWAMGTAELERAKQQRLIQEWIRGRLIARCPYKIPRPRPSRWMRVETIKGETIVSEDDNREV